KQILGVRESGHPASVLEPGIPTDMIRVQVSAHDKVDVFGAGAGACQTLDPGLVAHVESRVGGALFMIADAAVDEYGVMLGTHEPAVHAGANLVFLGVVEVGDQPVLLRLPHLGAEVGKHKGADEARALIVLNSCDFHRPEFQALPATINVMHMAQHTAFSDFKTSRTIPVLLAPLSRYKLFRTG